MIQMKLLMNSLSHFVEDFQKNLEMLMKGSDFIFDLVQLMYYKCNKINFKRGGSYIDSPDWIKNKEAIIDPKTEDDK